MLHFRHISFGFYQCARNFVRLHSIRVSIKKNLWLCGRFPSSMLKITNFDSIAYFFAAVFATITIRTHFNRIHYNVIDRSSLPPALHTNLVHSSDTHAYSILFVIFACIIASRVLHRAAFFFLLLFWVATAVAGFCLLWKSSSHSERQNVPCIQFIKIILLLLLRCVFIHSNHTIGLIICVCIICFIRSHFFTVCRISFRFFLSFFIYFLSTQFENAQIIYCAVLAVWLLSVCLHIFSCSVLNCAVAMNYFRTEFIAL